MTLTKHKLGTLIEIVDEKNKFGYTDFYGLNINKEFMPTVADTDNLDASKYKVVRKNRFVFSGMQTGRDKCIRISMYQNDNPILVSPAYTTFEVVATDIILPEYLFMRFLSKEKDRLGWFLSDSSIRSNLDWNRFCDITLELPDIKIQEKFVNIYKSMVENQKAYETGLEDLKIVCDAYIEDLRRNMPCEEIGKYIREVNERNTNSAIKLTQGVDVNMQFIPAKREAVDQESTKIVRTGQFAFNKVVKANGTKLPIALRFGDDCVVSGSYNVFEVIDKNVLYPKYLMLWLSRAETHRLCGFKAWGSTRDVFDFCDLCKLQFPIPDIKIQQSIVDIYNAYIERKEINEKLKQQVKNICPILIKGSLQE